MRKSTDGKPLGMGLAWHLGQQGRESFVEQAGSGPGDVLEYDQTANEPSAGGIECRWLQ